MVLTEKYLRRKFNAHLTNYFTGCSSLATSGGRSGTFSTTRLAWAVIDDPLSLSRRHATFQPIFVRRGVSVGKRATSLGQQRLAFVQGKTDSTASPWHPKMSARLLVWFVLAELWRIRSRNSATQEIAELNSVSGTTPSTTPVDHTRLPHPATTPADRIGVR